MIYLTILSETQDLQRLMWLKCFMGVWIPLGCLQVDTVTFVLMAIVHVLTIARRENNPQNKVCHIMHSRIWSYVAFILIPNAMSCDDTFRGCNELFNAHQWRPRRSKDRGGWSAPRPLLANGLSVGLLLSRPYPYATVWNSRNAHKCVVMHTVVCICTAYMHGDTKLL